MDGWLTLYTMFVNTKAGGVMLVKKLTVFT